MTFGLTVVLFLLGGFLLGGVYSLWQQKANKVLIGVVAFLCLLAFAAAVLRVI